MLFVLLVLLCYGAYPYYVVFSLQRALHNRRSGPLSERIDFASIQKALPLELAQRLEVNDPVHPNPAPALESMSSEGWLRKASEGYLQNGDSFLRLFIPVEVAPPVAGPEKTAKLTVTRAAYGGLGYTFLTSLSEFCITLNDVALEFKVLPGDVSVAEPIELQAKTPRLKLYLQLAERTWKLVRVELPHEVQCLAFLPWVERRELAGTWRVQGGPELELEVAPESNPDLARLFRYQGNSSLTEVLLRESPSPGGRIRAQYRRDGQPAQAEFSKDRQGKLLLALEGRAPLPLTRIEPTLLPAELHGIWKPGSGDIEELEIYGDTVAELGGTGLRAGTMEREEGTLRTVRVAGGSIDMVLQWPGNGGSASLGIRKRSDGTFFLASKGSLAASEVPYVRLEKTGELPPVLTAEDVSGRWETDRLLLLELTSDNDLLHGGSIVPRDDPRWQGQIKNVTLHRHTASWQWLYLNVLGSGSIAQDKDGALRVKLELDTSETFKRMFGADGHWYPLRPFQPPPEEPEQPIQLGEYRVTLKATGFPDASPCALTMRAGLETAPETVVPEWSGAFTEGTVVELEAPARVGGHEFTQWEGVHHSLGTKAWVTNNLHRTVYARYKGWQGVWKTAQGREWEITQKGATIVGRQAGGGAQFVGDLLYDNQGERLQDAMFVRDGTRYNISVRLAPDCRTISGVVAGIWSPEKLNPGREGFSASRVK